MEKKEKKKMDTVSYPPPSSTPDASSGEGEDDIIDVGNCGWSGGNRDGVRFCSLYKTPPAKVKSSITEPGIMSMSLKMESFTNSKTPLLFTFLLSVECYT